MDVEKLIQAAEWCKNGPDFPNLPCGGCPIRRDHPECMEFNDIRRAAQGIITVRDHCEAMLNAERSKVIAEVREFLKTCYIVTDLESGYHCKSVDETLEKLNSMEQEVQHG